MFFSMANADKMILLPVGHLSSLAANILKLKEFKSKNAKCHCQIAEDKIRNILKVDGGKRFQKDVRQLAEQLKFSSSAHSSLSSSMLSMSSNMMSPMRLSIEDEAAPQSSKLWLSPILQSSAQREVIDVYSGNTPLNGAFFLD